VHDFAGRVALITGGASPIGQAISERMAERGAAVIAVDILYARARPSSPPDGRVTRCYGDVGDPDDVARVMRAIELEHGRLDVICNNAAVTGSIQPLDATSVEDFDHVIGVNLRGPFLVIKFGAPLMSRSGGGSIINVGSLGSMYANPGMAAYMSAKGGLLMLTKVAALDYAESNIRVNAVCPGTIDTPTLRELDPADVARLEDLHPVGRLGTADEIAAFVEFLASDDAAFATGAVFTVDGGRSATLRSRG
jgi:NAD(P)-dependent dehydrogenase (short-subunit alcohol dehydrogenase family)